MIVVTQYRFNPWNPMPFFGAREIDRLSAQLDGVQYNLFDDDSLTAGVLPSGRTVMVRKVVCLSGFPVEVSEFSTLERCWRTVWDQAPGLSSPRSLHHATVPQMFAIVQSSFDRGF
jgi:hypothetical protein